MWSLNRGGLLIEVVTRAGLTVPVFLHLLNVVNRQYNTKQYNFRL